MGRAPGTINNPRVPSGRPKGGKGKKGKEPMESKDPVEPLGESLRRLSVSEEPSTSTVAQSPPQQSEVTMQPEEEDEGGLGVSKSRKPRRRKPKGGAAAQAPQQGPSVQTTASLPSPQQFQQKPEFPTLGQPQASYPQSPPQQSQHRPQFPQGQPPGPRTPLSPTSPTDQPPRFPQGQPPRARAPFSPTSPTEQRPQFQQRPRGPSPRQQRYPPQQQGYPPQQQGYPPQQPPQQHQQWQQPGGYPPQQQPSTEQKQQWRPASSYAPQQQPVPTEYQQQGHPTGGYPPQQRGHPPRQQGYPPQQQGYPAQQQGHPPRRQGHPPQQQVQQQEPMVMSPPQGQQGQPKGPSPSFHIPAKIIGRTVPGQIKKVLANYLPMSIKPMIIYRYDVSYSPDKPKKILPKAFQKMLREHFRDETVAYDQMKLAFAAAPLPNIGRDERKTFEIFVKDDSAKILKIKVSLKPAGIADTSTIINYMKGGTSLSPPSDAIQCIDVVIRQGTLEKYVKAGRTFFTRPANPIDLSDGLEMWTGLFQSAIFTSRPYINIDVAHKGFPINQPMSEVLKYFGYHMDAPLESQRGQAERLKAYMRGLKLTAYVGGDVNAGKRDYIFNEFVEPPSVKRFNIKRGPQQKEVSITVAQYFEEDKNLKLKFKNANCLWVGPKEKNIFYPMELMEVTYGQVIKKQLGERQLATMVREAATPPHIRKQKIYDVIRDMNYSSNIYFKQFGLEIGNEFIKLDSKVIRPPKLEYASGEVEPRNGQWYSGRMLQAAKLVKWGYVGVHCDARQSNIENVTRMFKNAAREMGMEMNDPFLTRFNIDARRMDDIMMEASRAGLQLLFVVVGYKGPKDAYAKTKQSAELKCGVLTQCIKENTTGRMNPQTAKNILLKVNAKLMGVNQALHSRNLPRCLQGGGIMVVGADVTHPSPDQSNVPSIAAVTASIDRHCFQYNIGLSIQTPKKEMIVEFEDMMVEHMKVYRERHHELPKKIYVFRDGVSEGQFAQVMQSELRAITRAYQTLNNGQGKPEILFLLVQKRHHTRLFTTDPKAQNVEPGTVVDTEIVHARELDFYLVSHQAIKGTARPTRYHAVCNDGGLPSDEVEQLAYYLCHLYSRCSRSVSYPTPTYYAHLACLRARYLTLGIKYNNDTLEAAPKRLRVMDKMLNTSRMFFV